MQITLRATIVRELVESGDFGVDLVISDEEFLDLPLDKLLTRYFEPAMQQMRNMAMERLRPGK